MRNLNLLHESLGTFWIHICIFQDGDDDDDDDHDDDGSVKDEGDDENDDDDDDDDDLFDEDKNSIDY